MATANGILIPTSNALKEEILGVFAEVTRYPVEILDPDANLEEDLGIDSVKLGEIFSVLREKYNLPVPEELNMPRESLRTINGLTEALHQFLTTGKTPQAETSELSNSKEILSDTFETNNMTSDLSGLVKELNELKIKELAKSETQQDVGKTYGVDPSGLIKIPSAEEVKEEILAVFADVTRYPKEILDPDANLEEDLGIDSVKLGEIFSVLRERYQLPDPETLNFPRESLKTISDLSSSLHDFLSGNSNWAKVQVTESNSSMVKIASTQKKAVLSSAKNDPSSEELKEEILAVFADVTRYPKDILDSEASLEEDLGIDSVKLGEIFSVLRERYQLPDPETLNMPRESLKTIKGISEALHEFLSNGTIPGEETNKYSTEVNSIIPVSLNDNGTSNLLTNENPNRNGEHAIKSDVIKESFANLRADKKPFEGKIGFISGSGRGLGKEIAMYLADLGATIIINSFHSRTKGEETEKEIKAKGGNAYHIWGSMANPQQLNNIFDQIEAKYGYLDFFISNASNGMLAPIEKLEVEHWQKAFMTNVVGLQQGAVRAVKMMKKKGQGKIITLSSPAAHGYVEYFAAMGAVKAAVESLTKAMAIEFAPYNIQVNCVSPGPLRGELISKWPESKRLVDEWEKSTPYERLCNGNDVAHFIAYLLSDPVKLFTGSILVQDGGISSKGW